MGVLVKFGCFLTLVAVLVGVAVVKFPLPDDIEDKWLARGVDVMMHAIDLMATAGAKLKLGSRLELLQVLTENAVTLFTLGGHSDVKERWEKFGDVPVLFSEPPNIKKNGPAIVYIHGGGWTWFSPNSFRYITQSLAKETGYLVVSVDYRLSPPHKYPSQFQDCLDVVRYLVNHADKYYVDKSKIILAGDSAGGQLTAAVSHAIVNQNMKETKIIKPFAQVLIYPVLQFVDFSLPSFQSKHQPVFSTAGIAWFSQVMAFGDENFTRVAAAVQGEHISPQHKDRLQKLIDHNKLPKENFHEDYVKKELYTQQSEYKELEMLILEPSFSPLLAPSLKGMPPTLVITMQYDVLRDDGYLYVARCKEDGVQVEHINYIGWHGAIIFRTKFPFFKDIGQFVKKISASKKV